MSLYIQQQLLLQLAPSDDVYLSLKLRNCQAAMQYMVEENICMLANFVALNV